MVRRARIAIRRFFAPKNPEISHAEWEVGRYHYRWAKRSFALPFAYTEGTGYVFVTVGSLHIDWRKKKPGKVGMR